MCLYFAPAFYLASEFDNKHCVTKLVIYNTQMPVMTCLLQSNLVASLFALIINISFAQPIEL